MVTKMNDLTNPSENELQRTIFEYSQENYIDLFERFETNMEFKGKSINEWMAVIKIPSVQEDISTLELEKYTLRISKITDIIMDNYALARANYTGLNSSLERVSAASKLFIMDEIEQRNLVEPNPAKRIKKPTVDVLEAMVYDKTKDLQLSVSIAEMFFVFWEVQFKKINLLNQRVTSLNVLKNIESKNS